MSADNVPEKGRTVSVGSGVWLGTSSSEVKRHCETACASDKTPENESVQKLPLLSLGGELMEMRFLLFAIGFVAILVFWNVVKS